MPVAQDELAVFSSALSLWDIDAEDQPQYVQQG
jgi:hypothetical protein